jgi:hypothetical protein
MFVSLSKIKGEGVYKSRGYSGCILADGLRTLGPGLDAADRHDLSALKATDVIQYAQPDFSTFAQQFAQTHHGLLAHGDE